MDFSTELEDTVPVGKNIIIKCSSAKNDFLNHIGKLELVKSIAFHYWHYENCAKYEAYFESDNRIPTQLAAYGHDMEPFTLGMSIIITEENRSFHDPCSVLHVKFTPRFIQKELGEAGVESTLPGDFLIFDY